jgi:hypothetical protein
VYFNCWLTALAPTDKLRVFSPPSTGGENGSRPATHLSFSFLCYFRSRIKKYIDTKRNIYTQSFASWRKDSQDRSQRRLARLPRFLAKYCSKAAGGTCSWVARPPPAYRRASPQHSPGASGEGYHLQGVSLRRLGAKARCPVSMTAEVTTKPATALDPGIQRCDSLLFPGEGRCDDHDRAGMANQRLTLPRARMNARRGCSIGADRRSHEERSAATSYRQAIRLSRTIGSVVDRPRQCLRPAGGASS